jgi:hypothetical protein
VSKKSKAAPRHSPEQLMEFTRTFAPKARRYRQRLRIVVTLALIGGVGPFLFIKFSTVWPWAFLIGWVLAMLSLLFGAIASDFLPACPACRADIGRVPGKFCVACGMKLVEDNEWRGLMVCPTGEHAQRTQDSEGRERRCRVHHCPQCGLLLDEKGV